MMDDNVEFQEKLKSYTQSELLNLYRTFDRKKDLEKFFLVLEEIQTREQEQTSQHNIGTGRTSQLKASRKDLEHRDTQHHETQRERESHDNTPQEQVFYHDNQYDEILKQQESHDTRYHEPQRKKESYHDIGYDEIHKQRHMDTDYDNRYYISSRSVDSHHAPRHRTSQRHEAPYQSFPKLQRRRHKGAYLALIFAGILYYLAISLVGGRFYEWNSDAVPVIMISTLLAAGMCIMINFRIPHFIKAVGLSIVMAFFIPAAFGLVVAILRDAGYLLWLPIKDSYLLPSFISIAVSVAVIVGSIFHIKQPHHGV